MSRLPSLHHVIAGGRLQQNACIARSLANGSLEETFCIFYFLELYYWISVNNLDYWFGNYLVIPRIFDLLINYIMVLRCRLE